MELSDPSGSFYGHMAVMDPHRLNVTPGSGSRGSGGNGGRSVAHNSSRRRSRMSTSSTGTSLMPQFNAAANGGGSDSPSTGGLDEPRLRNVRPRAHLESPPTPSHLARLLFGSPMGSPATEDDVIIMDGELVGNNGSRIASSTRRSVSFNDLGLVASGSPGSGGGSSCGSNAPVTGSPGSSGSGSRRARPTLLVGWLGSGGSGRRGSSGQFAQRREVHRGMQAMNPRYYEMQVGTPSSGRSIAGPYNMQGSPNNPHLFPPALAGLASSPAAPRAVSSYTNAAVPIMPPLSYFTPPRVTVRAARRGPSTPTQPETMPVQQQQQQPEMTTFAWPPTAQEDASIEQQLYGASTGARRRLPVFQDICPEE